MHLKIRIVFAAAVLLAAFSCSSAAFAADDLNSVLSRLDAASAKFHTTSADIEWDSTQTEPIPDTDVQKGVEYYERTGSNFQIGVHLATDGTQSAPKVVVCCSGGTVQIYDKLQNEVTKHTKLGEYGDWFRLGFGAGGKELAAKWNIKYDGMETIDGVKTAKLELIAKDPSVLKTVPKVIIWVDPDRAVSLKQYFDEGNGQSRTCIYSNIKVNQPLPKDAFSFATDSKTTHVNR